MGGGTIVLGLSMGVVSMGEVSMEDEYNIFGGALDVKNTSFSRCP